MREKSRHTRRSWAISALVAITTVASMAGTAAPAVAAKPAPFTGYVSFGMPFAGNFANGSAGYADTYPDQHPIYSHGAQWSTDLYATGGTSVVPAAVVTATLKVESVRRNKCGTQVKVSVTSGTTVVGVMSFSHLVDVPRLKKHQVLNPGTSIGHIARHGIDDVGWPTSCWQVTSPGGTHTHFESIPARNSQSCYVAWNRGKELAPGSEIGRFGNTGTTGIRQPCPANPPDAPAPPVGLTATPGLVGNCQQVDWPYYYSGTLCDVTFDATQVVVAEPGQQIDTWLWVCNADYGPVPSYTTISSCHTFPIEDTADNSFWPMQPPNTTGPVSLTMALPAAARYCVWAQSILLYNLQPDGGAFAVFGDFTYPVCFLLTDAGALVFN